MVINLFDWFEQCLPSVDIIKDIDVWYRLDLAWLREYNSPSLIFNVEEIEYIVRSLRTAGSNELKNIAISSALDSPILYD